MTVNSGGSFTQSGGTFWFATNTSTSPSDNLVINANGHVNQSGGTIAVHDFTVAAGSPGGTYTQSGTGLFKISHDYKNSGVFTSTGGTFEPIAPGNAGGANWNVPLTATHEFFNVVIDSGVTER